ncbi:MAG: NAD-dependent epimerase/dehydratase family protein [Actinomycetota bacterium]
MEVLILGGTAWLGQVVATEALAAGHAVTCLARGSSGAAPKGARLVVADRSEPDAYTEVSTQDFDAVLDLTWQPGFAVGALQALGPRAAHWTSLSSISAYADQATIGADEQSPLLEPHGESSATIEHYGQAKVACEEASAKFLGDRLLIVRPGLIGGRGDHTGRSGAWVTRASRSRRAPMLIPYAPTLSTQVIDVTDLAVWLVACMEKKVTGTFNAVGPAMSFAKWIALSRNIGGHEGPVIEASPEWLLSHDVGQWAGPESFALWVAEPSFRGWGTTSGAAAEAAGLTHRSRTELLLDVLDWERSLGNDDPLGARLSAAREDELLSMLFAS